MTGDPVKQQFHGQNPWTENNTSINKQLLKPGETISTSLYISANYAELPTFALKVS